MFRGGIVSIVKFIAGILLLPAVVVTTMAFQKELLALKGFHDQFAWGILAYVLMHLFVFTPQGFYQFWQRIFSDLLHFSSFLSSAVPLLIPMVTSLLLLILYILEAFFKDQGLVQVLIFFVGFSLAMHIILSAQELYEEESNPLKPHYLFAMCLIYIVNIIIVVFLLDLNFETFSTMKFFAKEGELLEKTYLFLQQRLFPAV